ncbi:cupin domain-containing protein [Aestuariicella sp. G3-2]|uniref:cupin domain-containing protein n=1 Tax=Pseudomaricurvus albidus TaxID=2842452 RepID=UPI001C0E3A74|nr:cupin domain-containing protein [Aestuariicella albida]MBU3068444.1 cupin domain-containing protein [Aestuariicella albida]
MESASPQRQALIDQLQLEPHVEGGYFRRTYQSDNRPSLDTEYGSRLRLTSIYYLLTDDSPIGHWHLNRSDILHFFHLGRPITYYLLDASGNLSTQVMGPDPSLGHQLQLLVPGGTWKASCLTSSEDKAEADYGLISEAVCPGFEFDDMTLGTETQLLQRFPQHAEMIRRFTQ